MKRILYVSLFLLSIGLGVGLATYLRSEKTAAEPAPVLAMPENDVATQNTDEKVPVNDSSLSLHAAGSAENPISDLAEIEKILASLSEKNHTWNANLSGWVHKQSTSQSFTQKEKPGDVPEWLAQENPDHAALARITARFTDVMTDESWFYYQNGVAGPGFMVMKNSRGEEVQKLVDREDGLGANLTYLEFGVREGALSLPESERQDLSPPARLFTEADWLLRGLEQYRGQFTIFQAWLESTEHSPEVWVFYIELPFKSPEFPDNYPAPVVGEQVTVKIDANTGELMEKEIRSQLADGRWFDTSKNTYLVTTHPELPEQAQKDYQRLLDELEAFLGE